jgi:hypothetical protein
MNLQETIRRILIESTQIPPILRRRIDIVDDLFLYEVRRNYKSDSICKYGSCEVLLEVIVDSTIEHMFWNYFSHIDDGSKTWVIMYNYMSNHLTNKFGDKIKEYYHINCA